MRAPFLLFCLGVSIPLAAAGALGLSQTAPQAAAAEGSPATEQSAEADPQDAGEEWPVTEPDAEPPPRRTMECRNRCVMVDGARTRYQLCRPYVAPDLPNPFSFPAERPGPACMPFVGVALVAPTSRVCWVGPRFCRTPQAGRNGSPCQCYGRSGYFG